MLPHIRAAIRRWRGSLHIRTCIAPAESGLSNPFPGAAFRVAVVRVAAPAAVVPVAVRAVVPAAAVPVVLRAAAPVVAPAIVRVAVPVL